jgi:hypothetical protein
MVFTWIIFIETGWKAERLVISSDPNQKKTETNGTMLSRPVLWFGYVQQSQQERSKADIIRTEFSPPSTPRSASVRVWLLSVGAIEELTGMWDRQEGKRSNNGHREQFSFGTLLMGQKPLTVMVAVILSRKVYHEVASQIDEEFLQDFSAQLWNQSRHHACMLSVCSKSAAAATDEGPVMAKYDLHNTLARLIRCVKPNFSSGWAYQRVHPARQVVKLERVRLPTPRPPAAIAHNHQLSSFSAAR